MYWFVCQVPYAKTTQSWQRSCSLWDWYMYLARYEGHCQTLKSMDVRSTWDWEFVGRQQRKDCLQHTDMATGPLPKLHDLRTILSSRKLQRTRFQKTTWAGYHIAIKDILLYSHKYSNIFIIIIILKKNMWEILSDFWKLFFFRNELVNFTFHRTSPVIWYRYL